jgi:hypothetical protein
MVRRRGPHAAGAILGKAGGGFPSELLKDKYFERIGGSIEAEPLEAQVQSVF